jgi:hypothetical protein
MFFCNEIKSMLQSQRNDFLIGMTVSVMFGNHHMGFSIRIVFTHFTITASAYKSHSLIAWDKRVSGDPAESRISLPSSLRAMAMLLKTGSSVHRQTGKSDQAI